VKSLRAEVDVFWKALCFAYYSQQISFQSVFVVFFFFLWSEYLCLLSGIQITDNKKTPQKHSGMKFVVNNMQNIKLFRKHPLLLSATSHAVNSLSKVLFISPSRYLFSIRLRLIFHVRWSLPPSWHSSSKEHDSSTASCVQKKTDDMTGLSPWFVLLSRSFSSAPSLAGYCHSTL